MPALPELLLISLPLICLVVGVAVTGREIWLARQSAAGGDGVVKTPVCKRCQYCTLGYARMTEERVRCEGDKLVEVRCFVCSSCGLPQWTVCRIPIIERVG